MTDPSPQAFQVDLRGVVDLLARHLYSGPRVYVRELLQNGVDAITARHRLEPDAPARVRLRALPGGGLEVHDTGVGLTLAEAADLLATIGRSSKRDLDLGVGREEFLGQFGIGLLSAFMVAETIELVSRSATDPDARAIRWRGFDDGSYELTETDEQLEPGSVVRLVPRRDAEHWLAIDTVVALATEFGSLLPVDVAVEVPVEVPGGEVELAWRRVTTPELPWRRRASDEDGARRAALARYGEETFGFAPIDHIELSVPLAGVSGVAFVLPHAVAGQGGAHRVYVKRMLLGTRVDDLLPDWAFFVRCVINGDGLRPTASREALYSDEVLLAVQEELGRQVRAWLLGLLERRDRVARDFLATHHLAVRALATTDDEMLDLVAEVLPYETTDGTVTLAQLHAEHGRIIYATSVEEFRRVAPVARAQGLAVVNAGYVYDAELLARLATRRPTWGIRALAVSDVVGVLEALPDVEQVVLAPAVAAANAALDDLEVEAALRRFEPTELPALLLGDRDGQHQRDLAETRASGDDVWGDLLGGFAREVPARQLVLNVANPLVTRLLAAPAGPVRDAATRAVYVQALLLAGEPLRGRDAEAMGTSLAALLDAGLTGPAGHQDDTPTQEDA
ncbi:MAG: HSP90 family protein [Actinomycetales bacterium]|nr:HSP90 family protein [Actinomycetales bacterium]